MKTTTIKYKAVIICFSILLLISRETEAQIEVDASGKVGISITGQASKLSVGGVGYSTTTGYIKNTGGGNGYAALRAEGTTPGDNSWHCYGSVHSVQGGTGYTYGVYATGNGPTAVSQGRSYGTYGVAGNATSGYNYGAYGKLTGTNNGAGVYGTVTTETIAPGLFAGFFDGKIRTTNDSPENPLPVHGQDTPINA